MPVTNEELLSAIHEMRDAEKAQWAEIRETNKRLRSIESAGVPVVCADREKRLRTVESLTGKTGLLGRISLVLFAAIAGGMAGAASAACIGIVKAIAK